MPGMRSYVMKISTILDHIDSGHFALPEFQRGYVWNKDQVRSLFDSMYRRHPIGTLLAWVTETETASYRGDGPASKGVVKLLLDGQQRMTTIYGIVRGAPPKFFDGNPTTLKNLMFNLGTETFEYFQPVKMRDDSLWIDVTEFMMKGSDAIGLLIERFSKDPILAKDVSMYATRLSRMMGILDIDLHVEEVTGKEKTIEVVVDIFNRVNSGGTKLSKGDLALAKICAEWPEARDTMKQYLQKWQSHEYNFSLDWLLRSVNTVVTGEARFQYLHDISSENIQKGLKKATKHIDTALNMISGRLGLDHDRVLFGKFGIPVIVRYLDTHQGSITEVEQDLLMFWYIQSGMWGRFSGSTESFIDKDLAALEGEGGGLEALVEQLRLWHGNLRVEPENFSNWGVGARFYPVLYMLTRMGEAKDWGTGLALKKHLLGNMNSLEVHHIFPRAQLYKTRYTKPEVNALANFCFLTKETNIKISDRLPEQYFEEIEQNHPGALASQWIPMDRALWKINNYLDFLAARRELLSEAVNLKLEELLHGEIRWLEPQQQARFQEPTIVGNGISSTDEELVVSNMNTWMEKNGLSKGIVLFDYSDKITGEQKAIFDLAWPNGIQEGLSDPIALLIDEDPSTVAFASSEGYRCFTDEDELKLYVQKEILN